MRFKAMKMVVLAFLPLAAQQAYAQGTLAGTSIDNTATVNYSVGAVAQPSVSSNTSSFLVDRRVNLTVLETGNADTVVSPGKNAQVLTFTVTLAPPGTMAAATQADAARAPKVVLTALRIPQPPPGPPPRPRVPPPTR